ncbi:MAG: C4-dicarboxylate ABC transporter [Gammaproteobacteria bacterium]|nr:MAG: C4-dicarboxylate ABC transporter [Gammaproteobacteria bacterium]
MKKKHLLLTLAIMGSCVFAKDVTIKFSHVVAEDTPKGQMALKFKELAEAKSNGSIKVEVFPNSQLFTDGKVLKAMLLGDVQMAAPALSKFSRFTKKLQVYDLPFLFKDMAAVEKFQQSEKGQELLKAVEKKGIIGLGYIHNGMKQLSANAPMLVPADAKGKKFRIMTSDVLEAQFEAVDAIPLKKPFSEVFTLLQTKAIDGQENTWSNMYSKKFFEVQADITETNHGLLDYMVVTSKKFMDSLSDEQKQIVKESLKESLAYGNQLSADKAAGDKQKIIDSGVSKVHTITAEQRQQWVEAMKPVWKQFENDIGADIIEAAVQSNQ